MQLMKNIRLRRKENMLLKYGLSNKNLVKGELKNRRLTQILTVTVLILAVLTAAIPGSLAIMRRADAQVALGNAKALRLALQVAATESYAASRPFRDPSREGGVTEEVWRRVLVDSKVPGDFWVLQTDESGYEVLRFLYREGDFTVSYCKDPLRYVVSYQEPYIQTEYTAVY